MNSVFFKKFKHLFKIQNILFERINNFLIKKISKDNVVYRSLFFLNKIRHKFLELIYNKTKPKGIVLIDNIQGNKVYVDTSDKDMAPKFLLDDFKEEIYEMTLFKSIIKKGMTVVDVGANVGIYSLIAAKLAGENGIVYAFEPLGSNYKLLCKNIEVNGYTNIVPINKAVSEKCGKAKFWFERDWRGSPSFSKLCVLAVSKHKTLGGVVL